MAKVSREKIAKKVIAIVSKYTDAKIEDINETNTLNALGIFSMDTMSVMAELEAYYKLELADWDIATTELSIQNLVEIIMLKKGMK